MNDRSVSVIIPAYLAEHSLQATLESVFAQELPPREIIVINDGSPDATAEVAKSFGARITYLEQENAGQGAARNAGLQIATGRFIAFLDADDYWLPGFLDACVRFLEQHPEAVAVSTGLTVRLANGEEKTLPRCLTDGSIQVPRVLHDFYAFWAEQDHVRTGSNVIRKSVIDRAGAQRADLRVSQDLEYWGYIATFGKWGFIPEPLWVGNSRAIGKRIGWLRKYRKRRRLCPSVEAWQSRILPRLLPEQVPYFETVRGRVAAGYAHNMVLATRFEDAYGVFRRYGGTMPENRVVRLMRWGAALGTPGWLTACAVLLARECAKSVL